MLRRSVFTAFLPALLATVSFGCASKNTEPAPVATVPVDTQPAALEYPAGPYGLTRDAIFPNLSWEARKADGSWGTVTMLDYHDPDGTRGTHAILIIVSAEWCNPCKEEARDLGPFYTSLYQPRGAKFISLMIENATGEPADQDVVDRWKTRYALPFDVAMDPEKSAIEEGKGIPLNYIVNPRNMKIMRVNSGVNPDNTIIPGLTPLLNYNGAPPLETAPTQPTGT